MATTLDSVSHYTTKSNSAKYLQNSFAVGIGKGSLCSSSNSWTVVLESRSSPSYNAHELFNLGFIQTGGSYCWRNVLHHVLRGALAVDSLVD